MALLRTAVTPSFDADAAAMDMFRAASAAREHSERVMELTATILKYNMGHYSVWCVEPWLKQYLLESFALQALSATMPVEIGTSCQR